MMTYNEIINRLQDLPVLLQEAKDNNDGERYADLQQEQGELWAAQQDIEMQMGEPDEEDWYYRY